MLQAAADRGWILAWGTLTVWLALAGARADGRGGAAPAESPPPDATAARIDRLIEDLGAEQFARRERAVAELQRFGLTAFDALDRAQSNPDVEIALRARHLLRSLTVRWFVDADPAPVKEALRSYDEHAPDERRTVLEYLAKLPAGQGVPALCRLARFESSIALAKRAALLIIRRPEPSAAEARLQLATAILHEVTGSRREVAGWLRAYVATLRDPEQSLPLWRQIVQQEEELFRTAPEQSGLEFVRDLLRWQAELLTRLQHTDDAHAAMVKTIGLLDGSREQLEEMVAWLRQREAWSTVEETARRYPARFQEHTALAYALAEANYRQGRREEADRIADRALKLNPDTPHEHLQAAYELQDRGLFEWSEREYRRIIDQGPAGNQYEFRARLLLAEMLHDQQQELSAAKTLEGLMDAIARDPKVRELADRFGREPGSIGSRMHYFFAEHYRTQGDKAQQLEQLRAGAKQDPTDADLLIAMYRVPDPDAAWRAETRDLIRRAVQLFREQNRGFEQEVAEAPIVEARSVYERQLATGLNQLAWLVSNTEGDYDEALQCSRRALELAPDTAGYLDTLGRCYYAKGDYENAVKHQSRAVELDPYAGQIRRQLELFQKALKAARKQPPEAAQQ